MRQNGSLEHKLICLTVIIFERTFYMTLQNAVQLGLAVALCFISLGSIKFTPIRKCSGIKSKIECYFKSTPKEILYFVIMFAATVAVNILLIVFYKNNSLIFNMKRNAVISVLWIAAYFDAKSYRIPNKLIILGLIYRAVLLIFELIFQREGLLKVVLNELVAAVIMLVISFLCMLIIKNGLGMGDAKLFMVMGLLLGLVGVMSATVVSLFATFFEAIFLLVFRKKGRKDAIAFAPSILVGGLLAIGFLGA